METPEIPCPLFTYELMVQVANIKMYVWSC